MLGDISGISKIYCITGATDMRRSIDGLMAIIRDKHQMDPYANAVYLFCGKRHNTLKALYFDKDGFLLMYMRIERGAFNWPRSAEQAIEISIEQYRMLMQGLEIVTKHPIVELSDPPKAM